MEKRQKGGTRAMWHAANEFSLARTIRMMCALQQITNVHSSLIRLWSDTEHWRCKRIFVTFEIKNELFAESKLSVWSFVIIISLYVLVSARKEAAKPIEMEIYSMQTKTKGQQPYGDGDRELEYMPLFYCFIKILRKLMMSPTRKRFGVSDWVHSWSKKVMHLFYFDKLYYCKWLVGARISKMKFL